MNARCKWKEFNKWWNIEREKYISPMTYAGGLAASIDDKLKELQKGSRAGGEED